MLKIVSCIVPKTLHISILRPLIWLSVSSKKVLHAVPSIMLRILTPQPPLWQLHSCKQTQCNLQQSVRGFPAQWGLCGFSGCALDVVYVFRPLHKAGTVVLIPLFLWHLLQVTARKQAEHFRCVFSVCSWFRSFVSCPAVSRGDRLYFELRHVEIN